MPSRLRRLSAHARSPDGHLTPIEIQAAVKEIEVIHSFVSLTSRIFAEFEVIHFEQDTVLN